MPIFNKTIKGNKLLNMVFKEFQKEKETISLIPSENIMSDLATKMYCSKSNNRYVIPIKIGGKFFMPGRENLGNIITLLEKKLCSIYKTKYTIVKSLSGLHQMDIIMSAMRKITSNIITLDKFHGGHSKTKNIAMKHGFNIFHMKLNFDTWDVDYIELKKIIKQWRGKKALIYIDHTITVNPFNIEKLLKTVPSNWIIYYDISQLQLFYFSHIFNFPTHKNFFFGGTTHKIFPGPQKAIILLNNKRLYTAINKEFEKTISSIHTGSLLALLITVIEMEKFGAKYAKNIISKTRYFAKLLSNELHLIGPLPYFTNTHQICIDVPNIVDITKKLASVGIITMPERTPSGKKRKGLRLGLQEQCRLGITKKDLLMLSGIIISCVNNKKINKNTKNKVRVLAKKLNSVHYAIN